MTRTAAPVQALTVETTPLDDVRRLIPFLDADRPLLWQRGAGENLAGIAGLGEALRLEFSGPTRVADAAEAWRAISAAAHVVDPLRVPGSGLVAFGTFAFADDSAATSVLIVPALIVGRRDGQSWLTRVSVAGGDQRVSEAQVPSSTSLGASFGLTMTPGELTAGGYGDAVAAVVDRIAAGEVEKVVLSRLLRAELPQGADVRHALGELAGGYPDCWVFVVDGFLGASPETLVRVSEGRVTAQVLAGTAARGADDDTDAGAAAELAASAKDRSEHAFAVDSVLDSLRPHTTGLRASDPFTLQLPNLWHLASDVAGTLSDGCSALDLVDALHPTAAVAGTPRQTALAVIRELEPFDRGRYAGPVGWIGADGSGEWAVALRSAQIADADGHRTVTAFAGGGIVADSDPVLEVAETTMKFRPIVDAFS
ncbi:isochorismate synthase MenF [Gryllotalpicola reticulitermitis]|uniref:isochorismate synthase n=1 Tax=Gryllotalpicola reticulitermitis TaxID=1184153 RepID=A0ABV8Q9D7_9MICO